MLYSRTHAATMGVKGLILKPPDHISSFPVAARIQYKLCLLLHNSRVDNSLQYLSQLLTPVSDIHSRSALRSARHSIFDVPQWDSCYHCCTSCVELVANSRSSSRHRHSKDILKSHLFTVICSPSVNPRGRIITTFGDLMKVWGYSVNLILLLVYLLRILKTLFLVNFYRAMHFSAKRGIAIACRLSVRLSVRPSVTLVNCDHIGWKSSKIILPSVSLACSLFASQTSRVYSEGNTLKFSPE